MKISANFSVQKEVKKYNKSTPLKVAALIGGLISYDKSVEASPNAAKRASRTSSKTAETAAANVDISKESINKSKSLREARHSKSHVKSNLKKKVDTISKQAKTKSIKSVVIKTKLKSTMPMLKNSTKNTVIKARPQKGVEVLKKGKTGKEAPKRSVSAGKKNNIRKKKPPKVQKKWTKEQKIAAAIKRQSRNEGAKDRMYRSVEDWEGNSDSEGSVDSGALEENICFDCGHLTIDDDNEDVIICDLCASEIHLKCLGLSIPPRKGYICPRCKEDEVAFEGLKYDVFKPDIYNLGKSNITQESQFPITKLKKGEKIEFCYSPSRPLAQAWSECLVKGFMCVQKVFDYQTMKCLTHGSIQLSTKSGRKAESWSGALREIERNVCGDAVHNLIDRNGRYDMRLPDFVVEHLGLTEKLQPILDLLKTVMGTPTPQIRTQNVVFAPVGSEAQAWHIDDTPAKIHRYFTILIHLNPIDEHCGGTEVYSKQLMKGDMVRCRPGDAFVFNGSLLHRGQCNNGQSHRLFYYASFACRADLNIAI